MLFYTSLHYISKYNHSVQQSGVYQKRNKNKPSFSLCHVYHNLQCTRNAFLKNKLYVICLLISFYFLIFFGDVIYIWVFFWCASYFTVKTKFGTLNLLYVSRDANEVWTNDNWRGKTNGTRNIMTIKTSYFYTEWNSISYHT